MLATTLATSATPIVTNHTESMSSAEKNGKLDDAGTVNAIRAPAKLSYGRAVASIHCMETPNAPQ